MKTATVQEIRSRLKELDKKDLIELLQRLARFKKENKELLHYLLFEADDKEGFADQVKKELDEIFTSVNTSSVFLAKKTLRKALRIANRYIRFTADKTVEAEILLHYCTNYLGLNLSWKKSTLLSNIFFSQIKKIETAISLMHEDLQYDYQKQLQRLKSSY